MPRLYANRLPVIALPAGSSESVRGALAPLGRSLSRLGKLRPSHEPEVWALRTGLGPFEEHRDGTIQTVCSPPLKESADFIRLQSQHQTDPFEREDRFKTPAGEPLLHFPVEQPAVEFHRTAIPPEGMCGVLQNRTSQSQLRVSRCPAAQRPKETRRHRRVYAGPIFLAAMETRADVNRHGRFPPWGRVGLHFSPRRRVMPIRRSPESSGEDAVCRSEEAQGSMILWRMA